MKFSKTIYSIFFVALVFAHSSFAHLEKTQCCFDDEGCIALKSMSFNNDLSHELSIIGLREIFPSDRQPFTASIKLRSKKNSNPQLEDFNFLAINISTFDKDSASKMPKDKLELEILVDGHKEKVSATVFATNQRELIGASKGLKEFQRKYTFEIGMQLSKPTLEKFARSKSIELRLSINNKPLTFTIPEHSLQRVQSYLKFSALQFLDSSKSGKELVNFIPKLQCSKPKTAEIIWEANGKKNA